MQLLQHFKDLTVHPKNAEELKGLILQLAIQGKLTKKWREENPDVEPAAFLLEKIQAEKTQLIKDKKIKKEKTLPEIEEDEMSFSVPESWEWARLGNIGSTNVGLTYKPAHITEDGVPVLRSSNIQNSEIDLSDLVRVNTEYRDKDIITNGDLLICARNGSRKLVGKCAIVENSIETMVFGAFMAIFRSDYNPYVKLFIQSPLYRARLDGVETTTINQITQGNLKATVIPIPPFEEQKAIVDIVNQLFREVEALEEQTKARVQLKEDFVTSVLQQLTTGDTTAQWSFLQDHFKTFFTEKTGVKKLRESILQLAVQGKLTKNWRETHPCSPVLGELSAGLRGKDLQPPRHSDTPPSQGGEYIEHASVLLEKIKDEKAQLIKDKKIKKEKPLPEITEDEIPYELPEGWCWCRVGELTTIKGGKRIPKGYQLSDDETPFVYIRVTDMKNGTVLTNKLKYITEEIHEIIKQYTISKDDLYITIAGTIGDVGEIPDQFNNMNLTENAAKIMLYDLNKSFMKLTLTSGLCRKQFLDKVNQMAQPKLALHRVASTLFPLPPVEEQKAIVAKVKALMGLCNSLEQHIEHSTTQVEQLMQSCLKEVFEE